MRILIIDDHQLFMDGLSMLVQGLADDITVVQAVSVADAREKLDDGISLVVMDLRMPGMKGSRTIEGLVHKYPDIPFVVVSATESQADIDACMKAGAMAFIPKSAPSVEMIKVLKKVIAGARHHPVLHAIRGNADSSNQGGSQPPAAFTALSERQLQVLTELAQGKTNKEIAVVLDISEHTVKYTKNIA